MSVNKNEIIPKSLTDQILYFLNLGFKPREIALELNTSPNLVRVIKNRLKNNGLIHITKDLDWDHGGERNTVIMLYGGGSEEQIRYKLKQSRRLTEITRNIIEPLHPLLSHNKTFTFKVIHLERISKLSVDMQNYLVEHPEIIIDVARKKIQLSYVE
jgi:DNA polymerase III delta prime subunit